MSTLVEFGLFSLVLAGIALFHRHALAIALAGLLAVTACNVALFGFAAGPGFAGLGMHLLHEWVTLTNLLALLTGFVLLANHVHRSRLPELLPRILPGDWTGGVVLLLLVFAMSAFLDNIAAALIGGTLARTVYRGKVHIGFLAAIVAASNAGGSGSVLGDTTTTMIWISGVSPLAVLDAYVAAVLALLVFGIPAARQQHRHAPIVRDAAPGLALDHARLLIVALALAAAIAANLLVNAWWPARAGVFPFIGAALWTALLLSAPWRTPDFRLLPEALRSAAFLLSLVLIASMMPVHELPTPSAASTFVLGLVSAVFDNIPLTAMALEQGGYDWGMLAFAVGFGGSMMWFGSSAGVALCGLFPEARSVAAWLRHGWHVMAGYVLGFTALYMLLGWHPRG